jgi:hypothetical protein
MLTLGEIIKRLEEEDPARVLPFGFGRAFSWRGDYYDLAFKPARNVTIGSMLAHARFALDRTFQGYKGGDYKMTENTHCWLANWGESSSGSDALGGLLFNLMLGTPERFVPLDDWDDDPKTLERDIQIRERERAKLNFPHGVG